MSSSRNHVLIDIIRYLKMIITLLHHESLIDNILERLRSIRRVIVVGGFQFSELILNWQSQSLESLLLRIPEFEWIFVTGNFNNRELCFFNQSFN